MHADAAAGGTSEGRQPTVDFHRAHVCHAYAGDRAPAQDRAISHANRAYEVFGRHNDTRTTFRRLRPRATLKHALDFRRHYYGTQRRPPATPVPLTWASVPEDYDVQLKALRRHLDISQAGFARLVGAAGKAVVYQWEARKRTPSPLFWQRVHELQSGVHPHPVP